MDGGAWWAMVHRVAKSQTRLSDLAPSAVNKQDELMRRLEAVDQHSRQRTQQQHGPPCPRRKGTKEQVGAQTPGDLGELSLDAPFSSAVFL